MNNIYEIIHIIAVFATILINVFWAKNYKIGKLKAFLISTMSNFIGLLVAFILTWIANGFKNFGAINAVRAYPFLVLIYLLEARIFHMDFLKVCDFQAATIPMNFALGHFACMTTTCCRGFYYMPGTIGYTIAHTLTGSYQLPLPLFESVAALIIFAIIIIYCKRTNFKTTGYAFVLFHMLYGSVRFLWEFLRDNKKIIKIAPMYGAFDAEGKVAYWGISNLAVWALAIFVVGVVMFICLRRYHKLHPETN